MLGKKKFTSKLFYNLNLDDLVPEDNIYRTLEKFLDLRFLYKECEKLYGKTGKPSIDPVVFFKLQLFGYFENIISDRELLRRANDSLAVRYFLGYDIDESLPWHSTISRTRGLYGEELFEMIFEKILGLCYQSGLIEGKHQTIDSTLVKANASLDNVQRKSPELTVHEYTRKTYQENKEDISQEKGKDDSDQEKKEADVAKKEDDDKNKKSDDKNELKYIKPPKDKIKSTERRNDLYESKTDPDSRMAQKPGTPNNMYYKTQYCADTKKRIITDVLTVTAEKLDKNILLSLLNRAEARLSKFNLNIKVVSADRGYSKGEVLRELESKNIKAFIPAPRTVNSKGGFVKEKFTFNDEENYCICPNQKRLKFKRLDKQKECYRYEARKQDCAECPLKNECCPDSKFRHVSRTIYYKEYDRLEERLKTSEGKQAYVLRKTIAEGLFAEAKNSHGLKKFMTRGLDKAQKRSYMIATVQNLKRLMKEIRRRTKTNYFKIFLDSLIIQPICLIVSTK